MATPDELAALQARNRRIFQHETDTPPRGHDPDGACCRAAANPPRPPVVWVQPPIPAAVSDLIGDTKMPPMPMLPGYERGTLPNVPDVGHGVTAAPCPRTDPHGEHPWIIIDGDHRWVVECAGTR